ncbi:MAG: chloride channel protein [Brachyspira sp.]|nr:chloride channel protein [Brachyspira sp.]
MVSSKRIFRQTEYFLQEIVRSKIIVQAILVGLISGMLVVGFKVSINSLFWTIQKFLSAFSTWQKALIFPLITTLGGLISGFLVFKFAPETKGSGIPYVKMTMARMGNMTRIRSIVVKFFAGVAGIGTGLSLGREGPSVQLGAGAGALVGRLFKMSGTNQDKLIAAGAGSAIGATFNAPIAGTIFVLEELVQKFTPSLLFPVLVATVSAASLARHFLGSNPSFDLPKLQGGITLENIPVCIILGLVAGLLGVLFSKVIFFNNKLFDKMSKIPNYFKPAIAGLAVGLIGLVIPYVLGSGNFSVDLLLQHKFSLGLVLIIFIAKFFVTPFCFGSGAAGGIFLPMLMLGSFLGYIVSTVCNSFGFHTDPIVIAILGMGAFLSAVARTPITAVVMVFEMTGGYSHILPIMLSAAIADLVAEKLNQKPIYASLIVQNSKFGDAKILSELKVQDYMHRDVKTLTPTMTIREASKKIAEYKYKVYPVINESGKILGVVTRYDVEDAIFQGNPTTMTLNKIMNPSPVVISANKDLYVAYFRLHTNNIDKLPVIDKRKRLYGIISREDIHNAIDKQKKENI